MFILFLHLFSFLLHLFLPFYIRYNFDPPSFSHPLFNHLSLSVSTHPSLPLPCSPFISFASFIVPHLQPHHSILRDVKFTINAAMDKKISGCVDALGFIDAVVKKNTFVSFTTLDINASLRGINAEGVSMKIGGEPGKQYSALKKPTIFLLFRGPPRSASDVNAPLILWPGTKKL